MTLRPRDIAIFEAIQRHGPLPSHYLYEFTKQIAKDRYGFLKRLKLLTDEKYLARPPQLNHPLIFTDYKVYILREKAEEALGKKLNKYATPVSGGYLHSFMASCITANIELGCMAAGLKYISQEEILSKKTCPEATKTAKKPLSLACDISYTFTKKDGKKYTHHSKRPTEPDQLFGIEYPNGVRFFALEADRGTEPLTRMNLNENSILRKVLSYKDILIRGEYKKQWGIPTLFPLFITTALDRVENMIELTEKIYPNGSQFLLFKAIPGFHEYHRTPSLMPLFFTSPFKRTGEPFYINK